MTKDRYFQVRLDRKTDIALEHVAQYIGKSKSALVRELIVQKCVEVNRSLLSRQAVMQETEGSE